MVDEDEEVVKERLRPLDMILLDPKLTLAG